MTPLVGTALKIVGPILGDVLGNKRASNEIMEKVRLRAMDVDETLIKAQQSTLEKELNGDRIQRSWRPWLMLLFGAVIAFDLIFIPFCNAIVFPFVAFLGTAIFSPEIPYQPARFETNQVPAQVWTIITIAIPGYIASRSAEKIAGAASGKPSGGGILERLLPKRKSATPEPPKTRTTVEVPVESSDLPFDGDVVNIPLQRGD